jgi:hypothetical protein
MNPKTVAQVFAQGHCSANTAVASFLCCAQDVEPQLLLREIPQELLDDFVKEVFALPDGKDVPIIGLDGFILKRESVERLKTFLRRSRETNG